MASKGWGLTREILAIEQGFLWAAFRPFGFGLSGLGTFFDRKADRFDLVGPFLTDK